MSVSTSHTFFNKMSKQCLECTKIAKLQGWDKNICITRCRLSWCVIVCRKSLWLYHSLRMKYSIKIRIQMKHGKTTECITINLLSRALACLLATYMTTVNMQSVTICKFKSVYSLLCFFLYLNSVYTFLHELKSIHVFCTACSQNFEWRITFMPRPLLSCNKSFYFLFHFHELIILPEILKAPVQLQKRLPYCSWLTNKR